MTRRRTPLTNSPLRRFQSPDLRAASSTDRKALASFTRSDPAPTSSRTRDVSIVPSREGSTARSRLWKASISALAASKIRRGLPEPFLKSILKLKSPWCSMRFAPEILVPGAIKTDFRDDSEGSSSPSHQPPRIASRL